MTGVRQMPTIDWKFPITRMSTTEETVFSRMAKKVLEPLCGCGYAFEPTLSVTERGFRGAPDTNGNFSGTDNHSVTCNHAQGG
jgi:hypothetical protein